MNLDSKVSQPQGNSPARERGGDAVICRVCVILRFVSAFLWLGAILVGSLLERIELVEIPIAGVDKLYHTLGYAVACVLVLRFFQSLGMRIRHPLAVSAISTFLFGALVEILQASFTLTRNAELYDLLANSVGIGAALLISRFLDRS